MAVFTPVSSTELSLWLSEYNMGPLESLDPILSGIENTNYFVQVPQGRFVLTLFEKLSTEELPYYLGLMHHLASCGLPCPQPQVATSGSFIHPLKGKPATLVSRLAGTSCFAPNQKQCANLGDMLGQLHRLAQSYPLAQANPRGEDWRRQIATHVRSYLNSEQQARLDLAMVNAMTFEATLPHGPVHADLFRDNVLFCNDTVSGLIDFYFAGQDNWIYDLAIVANDWCITPQHRLDPDRLRALLTAYTQQRPVQSSEQVLWPRALLAASLRFWLSRLHDLHQPRSSTLLKPHDPTWFENIVAQHLESPPSWPL